MSKIVEIKSKTEENNKKLREELMEGLTSLPEDVQCALIAFRTSDGMVHTGFFNTSLVDEAVMLKVFDIDIMRRQWSRDANGGLDD